MKRYVIAAAAPLVLAGCPLDTASNDPNAGAAGGAATFANDPLAAGGAAALQQLVDEATQNRFPPPPPLSVLCKLQQDNTTFDVAKQLLKQPDKASNYPGADPESESQDESMAGLAYRFSSPRKSGGAGGAAGDASAPSSDSISLILMFSWSDGKPGIGTILTGIGGSKKDLLKGYILKEMSLTGEPYPGCWPHKEQ